MNIENRELSQKLVDTIDFLKQSISKISVYDLNYYSMTELYYNIAKKINELIEAYHEFGVSISEEVVKQNECLQYLLNEGLITEVVNKINQLVADGTMDTIINDNVFNLLSNRVTALEKEQEIGCVLRPTTNVGSPWELFQDGAHECKGVTGVTYSSTDGTITVNFDKTYDKIRSFNVFPDEQMKIYNLDVGASTGLNSCKLYMTSRLVAGFTLTFKQSKSSITVGGSATFIESATWDSSLGGCVVKFKNVPKQSPSAVTVQITNVLNLYATVSITGNREILIKFYKQSDNTQITSISGDWSCMVNANFQGKVDMNCTSVYDSNILSSMAIMYTCKMKAK